MNNYPTPETQFSAYANPMPTNNVANFMNYFFSSHNQPNMIPDYASAEKVFEWMNPVISSPNQPSMMHQRHLTASQSVLSHSSINSAYSNTNAFSTVTPNPTFYNMDQTSEDPAAKSWNDYEGLIKDLHVYINNGEAELALETINLLDQFASRGLIPHKYELIETLWSKIKNVDLNVLTNTNGFTKTSIEAYCMLVHITIQFNYNTGGLWFNKIASSIKKTPVERRRKVACCLIKAIARLDQQNPRCLLLLDGLIKLYFNLGLGDVWKEIEAQDAYSMLKMVFAEECKKLAQFGNDSLYILSQFKFSFISRLLKMFCFVFMGPIDITKNRDFMTTTFSYLSELFNKCCTCYDVIQTPKTENLKQLSISLDDCKRQVDHLKTIVQLVVQLVGFVIDQDPRERLTALFLEQKGRELLLNAIDMVCRSDDVKTGSFVYKLYAVMSRNHACIRQLPFKVDANLSLQIVCKVLNKQTKSVSRDADYLLHDAAEFWKNSVACNDQFRQWVVTPNEQWKATPLDIIIDITLRIGATLAEHPKLQIHSMYNKIFDMLLLFIQSSNLSDNPYRDHSTFIINNSNRGAIPLYYLILMRPGYLALQPLNPRALNTLMLIERCVNPPNSMPGLDSNSIERNLGAILLQFFYCFVAHKNTEEDEEFLRTLELSLVVLNKLVLDCAQQQNITALMHKLANTNLFGVIQELKSAKRLILLLQFIKFAITWCPPLIEPWKMKMNEHMNVWNHTCKSTDDQIRTLALQISVDFGLVSAEEVYGVGVLGVDI
ncbi:hypothetical protein M3Y94_01261700 [Aphelenchoides besseyi]|nr:hypothetical protein M3Y94_01261700 [Aphelenchoides besseyi]KAI6222549.1 hypothetical protein M3Y95_00905200 [Aphelenchoides besseyi]